MFIARDTFIELFCSEGAKSDFAPSEQTTSNSFRHKHFAPTVRTLCEGTWELPLGRCAE